MSRHTGLALRVVIILASVASVSHARPAVPGVWATHRDATGFTVNKPTDWQAQTSASGDIVVSDPHGTAAAMVRARVVPAHVPLATWLQQQYAATEPGLHNVRMLDVRSRSPQVAHAAFDYGSQVFQGRASVIAVRHGDVATLFVAAASREQFAQRLPDLTRILDSVRFDAKGGTPPQRAQPLQFTRWVDPMEAAYSTDLPQGWRAEGGLRRTTWNVRLVFSGTSPDGAMQVFSGDASVPRMFVQPNTTTASLGNREGQYNGPDATMILRFQRAEDFGATLARNRFAAQVTATRPRADLEEIARRNPLLQSGVSAASAADVEFRLPDGRIGVLTLTTFGASMGNVGATWWADGIHGFIAPVDRSATAAAAMLRMLTSGRENPQWATGEREHQVRMGQQFQAYQQWSRQLQQHTVAQRWLADETRQRGMREVLGGTVRLQDPRSGETFEAAAHDRYYFRIKGTPGPAAIGTDIDFKPVTDLDLTRLLRIGTDVPER